MCIGDGSFVSGNKGSDLTRYQRGVIQESLEHIGWRQAMKYVPGLVAVNLVVHGNVQFPAARADMPQAALLLVLEEQHHESVTFGSEKSMIPHEIARRRVPQGWQKKSEALRRTSTTPSGSCSGDSEMPDRVQLLTLYSKSDLVRAAGFIELLSGLFGSGLVEGTNTFDPTIAPAVAGVIASHQNMVRIDFEEPPAFRYR
ncbi:uncharacterized protein BDZ83DRAFT_657204 [Colletotrichum acutatum]|uniref:Uncharacterized protein n=1 Tax=Glomerella acutata TaxID=27357 RepID=A0AAD8U731_GLOAC|nr:uncharacterized protein BDZ83DRAFT_657204 [Colletotrichum acutatum]KAK1709736.1 hypothetical protein BDZ83DRAFT_657204 [Colletotrichum acutatum]